VSVSQKCTVTVDGTKFGALCASVQFSSDKDPNGMPKMGSLKSGITVWVDFFDDQNIPFSTLQMLFGLANVVDTTKIKAIKIEFWKDATQQVALMTYSFNGWISRFETTNPVDLATNDPKLVTFQGVQPDLNHILILDLEPAMDQANSPSITVSN
jgi:hypothetical protein